MDAYDLVITVYGTHKFTHEDMVKIENFLHEFDGVQHVAQEMRINIGSNQKVLDDQDKWLKEQGLL